MKIDPSKAERIVLSEKAFDRAVELSEDKNSKPTPALVELMRAHKNRPRRERREEESPSPGM